MLSRYLLLAVLFVPAVSSAGPRARTKTKPVPIAVRQSPSPASVMEDATRKSAEYLACILDQTRFVEAIQQRRASCDDVANRVRECIARVRDRQASNTGRGALIGLGAAVVTGGASLLYTGVGALIGHQTSDEAPNECGVVPACDSATIESQLASEGIRQRACVK